MESQGETRSESRAFSGTGSWLPWIGIAAYGLAGYVGLQLGREFRFGPPGDERPMYFLRTDLMAGASQAVCLATSLVIAFLARKRYPANARVLAWMSFLWSGGPAWKAAVVWLGSQDLLNPDLATTRWPSFEAYTSDPVVWGGQIAVWIGVLFFAGSGGLLRWKRGAHEVP